MTIQNNAEPAQQIVTTTEAAPVVSVDVLQHEGNLAAYAHLLRMNEGVLVNNFGIDSVWFFEG